MATAKTQEELYAELIDKAVEDEGFRAQLIDDPKAAIQDALGIDVPDSITITVHEDSATTAHLVLPPRAKLSEADLQQIAAGHTWTRSLYDPTPVQHTHKRRFRIVG